MFDTVLVFQNYPVSEVVHAREWALKVAAIRFLEQTNYLLSIVISAVVQVRIRFNYNASLLGEEHVKQISRHFEQMLRMMIKEGHLPLKYLNENKDPLAEKEMPVHTESLFDFE
jgi:hypothetical protein